MARAACRGTDVNLFFAAPSESPEQARELCERCPVRRECGDYALGDPDLSGWWAGTSAKQRGALRREAS
jgi:WhiB family redox-sensing transcriptional regulator